MLDESPLAGAAGFFLPQPADPAAFQLEKPAAFQQHGRRPNRAPHTDKSRGAFV
jgi:hypothetical protein